MDAVGVNEGVFVGVIIGTLLFDFLYILATILNVTPCLVIGCRVNDINSITMNLWDHSWQTCWDEKNNIPGLSAEIPDPTSFHGVS